MIDDPIVAEVRRVREEYARRFNFDLWAMYRDLKRREAESDWPLRDRSEESPGTDNSAATASRAAHSSVKPKN